MQLIEILFGSKLKIKILRHLVNRRNWWFNISELSRDMKINKGNLSLLIDKLEKENIIIISRKGRSKLFKLNTENMFVTNLLIPVFDNEKSFYEQIIKKIKQQFSLKEIESTILYGSYASENITPTSDIDLMLVIKKKYKDKISAISENVSKEFLERDIILRTDIIDISEFKKLYEQKEPLIINIINLGKVLYGKSIKELLK